MIDKSSIDIKAVAERYTTLKRSSTYNGGEWHGPCPQCGGADRFHVWPQRGRFWCRQCNIKGDVIELVKVLDGVGFKEACERLSIPLDQQPPPVPRQAPRSQINDLKRDYACFHPAWQSAANRFLEQSRRHLWSDKHTAAAAYLTDQRHLSIEAILEAGLGFNPTTQRQRWGNVNVWLPRGIVIPWLDGKVWRIRFRCLDRTYKHYTPKINGNEMKYPQVAGAANGLYNGWEALEVNPSSVVVLVEGEFDALALKSQVNMPHLVAVATGGVSQARVLRWVAALAVARVVYVAFDAEQAGALAAVWWCSALPNAHRLIPTAHDITDMVRAGHNLNHWLGHHEAY